MEKKVTNYWEQFEGLLKELIDTSEKILDKLEGIDVKVEGINDNVFGDYDADSSPVAWCYYEKMYDFVNEKTIYSQNTSKPIRILASIKEIEGIEVNSDMVFGGDCVFNFKKTVYDEIVGNIEDVKEKEKLKEKLNYCKKMMHSPYNFSLMPVTGGMNNRKQNLYDRPDRLLLAISTLLENIDKRNLFDKIQNVYTLKKDMQTLQEKNGHVITSYGINDVILFEFLLKIGSAEKYAKIFLNLDEINEMINNGKQKRIFKKNYRFLESYMNLAIAYWKIQKGKYEKNNSKKESDPEICQNTK